MAVDFEDVSLFDDVTLSSCRLVVDQVVRHRTIPGARFVVFAVGGGEATCFGGPSGHPAWRVFRVEDVEPVRGRRGERERPLGWAGARVHASGSGVEAGLGATTRRR